MMIVSIINCPSCPFSPILWMLSSMGAQRAVAPFFFIIIILINMDKVSRGFECFAANNIIGATGNRN